MRMILFGIVLILAGCSSTTTGTGDGGATPADLATTSGGSGGNGAADLGKASSTVTIIVPSDFTGTPRQLLVAAFDQFPVTGPPAGVLYQGTPAISAGATLHLAADASGLSGMKYLLAVLYMQGGGQFSPMPGVDYASAPATIDFGGQAMELPTLTLALVPVADGGP
jgi:hypothetical protein